MSHGAPHSEPDFFARWKPTHSSSGHWPRPASTVQEEITVVDAALSARRRIADLVKQRMLHGGSTRFNVDAATLAVAQAVGERDALEVRRVGATQNLQRLLGLGSDEFPTGHGGASAGAELPLGQPQ